jgi:hypothetical protein
LNLKKSEKASEHPVKKFLMKWVWRVQQIGAISTLVITSITLSLVVSNMLVHRIGNPYVSTLMAFGLLAGVIMTMGWFWDKKLQMWKEQNVVNVERNPYYMHKMTPKESLSYTHIWVPLLRTIAEKMDCPELHDTANAWDKWCKEQNAKDPVLNASVKELRERYFKEG